MTVRIGGKTPEEILLKKLQETIEKNNELTSEQNEKMVAYTKWLFGLTIGIGFIALIQLITMIISLL